MSNAPVLKDFLPSVPRYMETPCRLNAIQLSIPRTSVNRTQAAAFFAGHGNFKWFFRAYYCQLVIHGELLATVPDIAAFLRTLVVMMDTHGVLVHDPEILAAYTLTQDVDLLFTKISISRIEFAFDVRPDQLKVAPWVVAHLQEESLYSIDIVPGKSKSTVIFYNLYRKEQEFQRLPAWFRQSMTRHYRLEWRLQGVKCPYLNLANLEGSVEEVMERFQGVLAAQWWGFHLWWWIGFQGIEEDNPVLNGIVNYTSVISPQGHGLVRTPEWRRQVRAKIMDTASALEEGLRNLFGGGWMKSHAL